MSRFLATGMALLMPIFIALPAVAVLALGVAFEFEVLVVVALASAVMQLMAGVRSARRAREDAERDRARSGEEPILRRAGGHQLLWEHVDEIAAAAQVSPPTQIRISFGTTAAVAPMPQAQAGPHAGSGDDRTRPPNQHKPGQPTMGDYELTLSPTLLAGATVGEFRAVVAHEFGHVAEESVVSRPEVKHRLWEVDLLDALAPGLPKIGLWLHLQVWAFLEGMANRPMERRADEFAYRIAGPDSVASALRRTEALDAAQMIVMARYLPMIDGAPVLPSLVQAVEEVLRAPHRDLAELVDSASKHRSLSSSHPSTVSRISAAEAASALGGLWPELDAAPAHRLLDDGTQSVRALESDQIREDSLLRRRPAGDWATVVEQWWAAGVRSGCSELAEIATTPVDGKGRPISRNGSGTVAVAGNSSQVTARSWLTAVGSAGIAEVLRDPKADVPSRALALAFVAVRSLAHAGRIRVAWDWTGLMEVQYRDEQTWIPFRAAPGLEMESDSGEGISPLDALVQAVAEGRATAAELIESLSALGADLDTPLGMTATERAARPGEVEAVHTDAEVSIDGTKLASGHIALMSVTGIWLIPKEVPAGLGRVITFERAALDRELIQKAASRFDITGGPDLQAWPDSIWLSETAMSEVSFGGRLRPAVDLVMETGQRFVVRLKGNGESLGDVAEVLQGMAGSRLRAG